ncbi:tetratricopeptide repeat protein, partial [uncultured Parasutterella sp.]
MSGFFDKLPEISPKKQAPTAKPVFDPYAFLNLKPEPQTAEDRFKEAKELLSAESNTAIQYLKAAAEEEHAASLDLLGMLYATGQLLERDPKRAADLFRKAAVLGETNAKFHLAMALREGFGVRQNRD